MNFMKISLVSLVCAAAFATTAPAFAQEEAVETSEAVKVLSLNDIRALFNEGLVRLQAKIAASKNLSDTERQTIARDIENGAEVLRDQIDEIAATAADAGDRNLPVGVVLTYSAEVGFAAKSVTVAKYGPGMEVGAALFLKRNANWNEALRVASVGILTGGLDVSTDRNVATEKGLKFKLLIVRNSQTRPALTLKDFEGAYAGIGTKVSWFGGKDLGEFYFKADSWNPLASSVYVYSFRGIRAEESSVKAKGIYLDFPHDNDGVGFHF